VILERDHGSAAGSDYINASYIKVCMYVLCSMRVLCACTLYYVYVVCVCVCVCSVCVCSMRVYVLCSVCV